MALLDGSGGGGDSSDSSDTSRTRRLLRLLGAEADDVRDPPEPEPEPEPTRRGRRQAPEPDSEPTRKGRRQAPEPDTERTPSRSSSGGEGGGGGQDGGDSDGGGGSGGTPDASDIRSDAGGAGGGGSGGSPDDSGSGDAGGSPPTADDTTDDGPDTVTRTVILPDGTTVEREFPADEAPGAEVVAQLESGQLIGASRPGGGDPSGAGTTGTLVSTEQLVTADKLGVASDVLDVPEDQLEEFITEDVVSAFGEEGAFGEGVEFEFGEDFGLEDIELARRDGKVIPRLSQDAREDLTTQVAEQQVEQQFGRDVTPGQEFELIRTQQGFETRLSEGFRREIAAEQLEAQLEGADPDEVAIDGSLSVQPGDLAALREPGVDVDLTPEDVMIEGGEVTLSAEAEQRVTEQFREKATQDIEAEFESQLNRDLEAGDDFQVQRTDEGFRGQLTEAFQRELALEEVSELEEQIGVADADVQGVVNPQLRQEIIDETGLQAGEDFQLIERGESIEIQLTEQFEQEFQAEQRETIRGRLTASLQQQTEAQLDPETDIKFTEEDGQISAELTDVGRRREQVESAPIVSAAEAVGFAEREARGVAGVAADFRTFGREQREERVQPVFEDLREASGLEQEIEEFENIQEAAGRAEEELLRPAREFVSERTPTELAAAAAPVAVAEPTPAGELFVGGLLATAAVSETVRQLPAEQQLAIGQAIGAATRPREAAAATLTGEEPDIGPVSVEGQVTEGETQRGEMIIDRGEIVIDPDTGEAEVVLPDVEKGRVFFPPEEGALPPDQAPPELEIPIEEAARRERLGDTLTFPRDRPLDIQEDPIFLPEVQTPTAPKSQFTAGRFTPPEKTVDPDEPTEPFGGSEVSLDDDLEGTESAEDFIFPDEIPTPGQPAEEFADRAPTLEAGTQQQTILREREGIPPDPADVGGRTGGGGIVFRRDPRVAPTEPILETPLADIDLSLVDPELARVLREGPELTAEDPFDSTLAGSELRGRVDPDTVPGLFGVTEAREAERLATLEMADETLAMAPEERLEQPQRPGLATDAVTTPQQDTRTITTPTTARPGTVTTPTVTTPDFVTPTLTTPRFGTPTITTTVTPPRTPSRPPVPGILPEGDQPDPRRRDFDEFEKEFLEPVISPEEFIGADDGSPEALDLADDPT